MTDNSATKEPSSDSSTVAVEKHSHSEKASKFHNVSLWIEAIGIAIWIAVDFFRGGPIVISIFLWIAVTAVLFAIAQRAIEHEICRNKWVVWSAYLTVILGLGPLRIFRPNHETAFSIIPRLKYVELKTPRYYLIWNNGQPVRSPIHVCMLAQFTNFRAKAMMINSYQFEGRTTNGTWEAMTTINPRLGHIGWFFGTNWGDSYFAEVMLRFEEGAMLLSDYGDGVFPSVLNGKSIPAGATVTGNVFLEAPKHGFDGTIRCRVVDATDGEFVELVKS